MLSSFCFWYMAWALASTFLPSEITADGRISGDELADFILIQEELERISITVETLQLWAEQMLATGVIDEEQYQTYKNCRSEAVL